MGAEHSLQPSQEHATPTPELASCEVGSLAGGPMAGWGNAALTQLLLGEGDARVDSPDPAVNGRTVAGLFAEGRARAGRVLGSVGLLEQLALDTQAQEVAWGRELGLWGRLVGWLQDGERPDPGRWDHNVVRWQGSRAALEEALALCPGPEQLPDLGLYLTAGLQAFERSAEEATALRREFGAYLGQFEDTAGQVAGAAELTRDLCFATAISGAVVLAAPAAGAAAASAGAGLGLTGAGASAFTAGGTALAVGALGAGLGGAGRGGAALVDETAERVEALLSGAESWAQAGAAFDWARVGEEGWAGVERGFLDGLLAWAGAGLEAVCVRGASALGRSLWGAGGGLLVSPLRRALEGAGAAGVSGAVMGGLDGALSAALDGGSLDEVLAAGRQGALLGAALGAVGGGLAGGLGGAPDLQTLLREDPQAFAAEYRALVDAMTPEQQAAWAQELAGRRFVDAEHYDEAAAAYAQGTSTVPPEHRYGEAAFLDWLDAADTVDARVGAPLGLQDVQEAHGHAAQTLTRSAGQIRRAQPGHELVAGGGNGLTGAWSQLSAQQQAVLRTNPYLRLLEPGDMDWRLSPEQVEAGVKTAIIAYPHGSDVMGHLEEFFALYRANFGRMDPVDFAAWAQRELVSIHPFVDGNGRVSRLVMDHALQSAGLPPALLADPGQDYMVHQADWAVQVREGVLNAYTLATAHAEGFNRALCGADLAMAALRWGALLSSCDDVDSLIDWLYSNRGAP